jgi:t-SNARE complex subunit (syntaxin)
MMDIWWQVLLIALGVVVPAALLAGPRLLRWWNGKLNERAAKKAERDQVLQQVKDLMVELSDDMRCLYQCQAPQLDGIEVTLLALKGEHLNGNVDLAITDIRAARKRINDRLIAKVGCDERD